MKLEKDMHKAAKSLDFEQAAQIRDKLKELRKEEKKNCYFSPVINKTVDLEKSKMDSSAIHFLEDPESYELYLKRLNRKRELISNQKKREDSTPGSGLLWKPNKSKYNFDYDYEFWNSEEIRVRVPDGAYSGVVFVDTGKEQSDPVEFVVSAAGGTKSYDSKKIYLVQYTADINDFVSSDSATITLRCPVPQLVPSQPSLEFTEISPSPVLQNYQNCIIHQLIKNKSNTSKTVFKQTFVVPVYEINTKVNEAGIGAYKNMNQLLYEKYTKSAIHLPWHKLNSWA